LLSPVLAGEQTIQDIMLNDVDWYAENKSRCTREKDRERSIASSVW